MHPSGHLQQYAALLRIRRAAARRNLILTAVVYVGAVFGTLFSTLLVEPSVRALYLYALLVTAFGLGCISAASRLERIKGLIEFVDVLERDAGSGREFGHLERRSQGPRREG